MVYGEDNTRGGNAEAGIVGGEGLDAAETGIGCAEGAVECGCAVHVFGGVFEEAVAYAVVRCAVEGQGLEAAPAKGEDERIVGF